MPGEDSFGGLLGFSASGLPGRSGRALSGRDGCVQEGDFGYRVSYLEQEERESLSFSRYGYYSIPKCYTPLDMDAVNAAGITAVQNFPALQTWEREC